LKLKPVVSSSCMALSFITLSQTLLINKDTHTHFMFLKVITNTLRITGLEDKETKYVRVYHSENLFGEILTSKGVTLSTRFNKEIAGKCPKFENLD
jgi:hypothetical protein